MATFYAEVEFTLINTIKIEMPDGEIPTQEDIEDAMCYVDIGDNNFDRWANSIEISITPQKKKFARQFEKAFKEIGL